MFLKFLHCGPLVVPIVVPSHDTLWSLQRDPSTTCFNSLPSGPSTFRCLLSGPFNFLVPGAVDMMFFVRTVIIFKPCCASDFVDVYILMLVKRVRCCLGRISYRLYIWFLLEIFVDLLHFYIVCCASDLVYWLWWHPIPFLMFGLGLLLPQHSFM